MFQIIKGALYLRSAKNLRPINIVIHQDQSSQNSGLATSPLPNGDVDMLGLADGPQLADDEASNTHDGIKESDNYEGVKENIHPPKLKNKRTTKPKVFMLSTLNPLKTLYQHWMENISCLLGSFFHFKMDIHVITLFLTLYERKYTYLKIVIE